MRLPSIKRLRALFTYHAKSGGLYWRWRQRSAFATERAWRTWNSRYADRPAGTVRADGYRSVTLGTGKVMAARICLSLKIGRSLKAREKADHVDGNILDNSDKNLRIATNQQNMWNSRRHSDRKNNLPKGVYYYPPTQKFVAAFAVNRRHRHVGYFTTVEAAVGALARARRQHHGEFAKD